ncbi:unknown protein [Desulfotalea psychrophila LSv54]|uniref:Uncharacterized protein n=1 Tax=Desulfotalea psychrophila (strain LSv54 / DSM 12343) TaxID=177439 RepID=Q6AQ33_DESPS|nr:unknown protein [Desulfotalea psychrophila LSv54]
MASANNFFDFNDSILSPHHTQKRTRNFYSFELKNFRTKYNAQHITPQFFLLLQALHLIFLSRMSRVGICTGLKIKHKLSQLLAYFSSSLFTCKRKDEKVKSSIFLIFQLFI